LVSGILKNPNLRVAILFSFTFHLLDYRSYPQSLMSCVSAHLASSSISGSIFVLIFITPFYITYPAAYLRSSLTISQILAAGDHKHLLSELFMFFLPLQISSQCAYGRFHSSCSLMSLSSSKSAAGCNIHPLHHILRELFSAAVNLSFSLRIYKSHISVTAYISPGQ